MAHMPAHIKGSLNKSKRRDWKRQVSKFELLASDSTTLSALRVSYRSSPLFKGTYAMSTNPPACHTTAAKRMANFANVSFQWRSSLQHLQLPITKLHTLPTTAAGRG